MRKQNKCLALLLVLGWMGIACVPKEPSDSGHGEGTPLQNDIRSYQSVTSFTSVLDKAGLPWKVTDDHDVSSSGARPPFSMLEITVEHFTHHGMKGTLVVTFYNRRLMETRFYPAQFDQYRNLLARVDKLELDGVKFKHVPPYTEIWADKDIRGQYVAWIDARLKREVEEWIQRYS